MTRFAAQTTVPVERSIGEIRTILVRYGAANFGQAEGPTKYGLQFSMKERLVKFVLPLPDRQDKRYLKDGRGSVRGPARRQEAWEQDCRQHFRALALAIKAKLETVETGIASFEEEFYAHIVMPNGRTIYELTHESVQAAYRSGKMPPALLASFE